MDFSTKLPFDSARTVRCAAFLAVYLQRARLDQEECDTISGLIQELAPASEFELRVFGDIFEHFEQANVSTFIELNEDYRLMRQLVRQQKQALAKLQEEVSFLRQAAGCQESAEAAQAQARQQNQLNDARTSIQAELQYLWCDVHELKQELIFPTTEIIDEISSRVGELVDQIPARSRSGRSEASQDYDFEEPDKEPNERSSMDGDANIGNAEQPLPLEQPKQEINQQEDRGLTINLDEMRKEFEEFEERRRELPELSLELTHDNERIIEDLYKNLQ